MPTDYPYPDDVHELVGGEFGLLALDRSGRRKRKLPKA
jgi:hypothetical protein